MFAVNVCLSGKSRSGFGWHDCYLTYVCMYVCMYICTYIYTPLLVIWCGINGALSQLHTLCTYLYSIAYAHPYFMCYLYSISGV